MGATHSGARAPVAMQLSSGSRCSEAELANCAQRIVSLICKDTLELDISAPDIKEFTIFDTVQEPLIEIFMRAAHKDIRARRAMGSMVGMAVADSVGGLFEFLPVGTQGPSFNPKTLEAEGAFNKFRLKPGQWTDDTSMALCLADSLLCCDGYNGVDVRVRFWNWWNRGYNNTFRLDNERNDSVGLGGNISLSLLVMTQTTSIPPRFEGLGEDAGNGSIMRLAPVPIFFHQDLSLAMRVSAESSYTTHPGPSAADACSFLGYLIARAITRDRRGRRETAAEFLDLVTDEFLARPEAQDQPILRKLLMSAEPPGSKEQCWNWRDPKGPFLLETVHARGSHYNGYPVQKDYFGSYSMDGLAIALHSVYHTKTFMAAVSRCINFLGDADSTGAVCGQIAGAFYGIETIDSRLISKLNRWDTGQIALRGALLYALGTCLPEETRLDAKERSARALACDRRRYPVLPDQGRKCPLSDADEIPPVTPRVLLLRPRPGSRLQE